MTDSSLAEAKRINDICHQNNTAFILASIRGVFGQVFTDFGSDFTVFDTDGEPLSVDSWHLRQLLLASSMLLKCMLQATAWVGDGKATMAAGA